MNTYNPETDERPSQRQLSRVVAYSAHVQEAMRYDRLGSVDYPLVMTILRGLSQGYTEEQWKEEHQQKIKILTSQSGEKETSADAIDHYEQLIHRLKNLTLWPW